MQSDVEDLVESDLKSVGRGSVTKKLGRQLRTAIETQFADTDGKTFESVRFAASLENEDHRSGGLGYAAAN